MEYRCYRHHLEGNGMINMNVRKGKEGAYAIFRCNECDGKYDLEVNAIYCCTDKWFCECGQGHDTIQEAQDCNSLDHKISLLSKKMTLKERQELVIILNLLGKDV